MEDFQKIMEVGLFVAVCCTYVVVTFHYAKKKARRKAFYRSIRLQDTVMARVTEKKKRLWLCKFFVWKDHLGYFRKKPSKERVPAIVVDFDEKRNLYVLEEFIVNED